MVRRPTQHATIHGRSKQHVPPVKRARLSTRPAPPPTIDDDPYSSNEESSDDSDGYYSVCTDSGDDE